MAYPRRIIPGDTYLITRRCSQRVFRLRPCAETTDIFTYCLALAMLKTGVRLHAACVMSNHHHLVVTDPNGTLPNFLRELHRLVAKAVNALQGQWENLWAAEPCNVVRLVTDADVDEKVAYVAANPVAAGLVMQPEAWPGFLAWGDKTFSVKRPTIYFSGEGTCPPDLRLVVEPPPVRESGARTGGVWRERVGRIIARKVSDAIRSIREAGRTFLGPEAVVGISSTSRAQSSEERRGRVPVFAARAKEVRDCQSEVEREFRATYYAALGVWRTGMHDVVFPFGTWAMAVFHAARVHGPLLGSGS